MTDPGRGRHGLFVLFLVLLALASYAPSLGDYFIKDDLSLGMLTDGAGRFSWESFRDQLLWPVARTWDDIWRPVPALTWAADYLVFGPDAFAFHLWNVLGHALNVILLYWLWNRLTRYANPLAAFFGAALFALYPLNVEAILWTTQRTVVFGLLFSLLSLLAFDVWLHRRTRAARITTWVALALSILSREHGATLPASLAFVAFFFGPERPFKRRVLDLVQACAGGALLLAAYFSCRHAIWGRYTSGYSGWATMEDYARDNRVLERLPQTARALAVPVNRSWAGAPIAPALAITWDRAMACLQALAAGVALLGVAARSLRSARPILLLALAALFGVAAWLPVRLVFWVDPTLLNSRSGYHLVALLVSFLGVALLDPWSRRPARSWRVALAGLVALAYAAALQANLVPYGRGAAEVRGLQEAVVREASAHAPDAVIAVFDVPTEYEGCPTMDAYLDASVRPPFVRRAVRAHPFVLGLDPLWVERIRQLRSDASAAANARFYQALSAPPWLRSLFGVEEEARGAAAPELSAPPDGAIVLASEAEPVFLVRAGAAARALRLHLAIPGRALVLPFGPGEVELRDDGRCALRLSRVAPEGVPHPLSWPLERGFGNPLPVQWRVEARGEDGAVLGVSSTRRLLIVEDRFDAPPR